MIDEQLKKEILGKDKYGFEDLVAIMRALRGKGGCPWDIEQTHKSIRKDLIEETYELVEGIDADDDTMMREELGDVLLQVVFHSQIAQDEGAFNIDDVCSDICTKLIVRHPHVFGEVNAETSDEVLKNWEIIKNRTKHRDTDTDVLRSISKALPSLMRAQKLGSKSRKWGFDFDNAYDASKKIAEETAEAMEAYASGDKDRTAEEFGDLLLAVVNAARLAGVDAEKALYDANEKYIARFAEVERLCLENGHSVTETPVEKKEEFWQAAKSLAKKA